MRLPCGLRSKIKHWSYPCAYQRIGPELACFLRLSAGSHGHRRLISRCCWLSSSILSSSDPPPVVDLSEFLMTGCDWRQAPKCPDYAGPVTIKRTPDGRGRGLYATRDVNGGEVLLIGNALAASYNDSYSKDLFAKICVALKQSPWALHRYYLLADCDNQEVKEIPSVHLFDPATSVTDNQIADTLPFDEKRIFDIMHINSFEFRLKSPFEQPVKLNGMYLLPSLINHSCIPNASRLFVGEAMVVTAAQKILANEEITIEYTDSLMPLKKRESILEWICYGFECTCQRCVLERSVQEHLEGPSQQFLDLYDKAVEEVRTLVDKKEQAPFSSCKELATTFDEVKKKISTFEHLTKRQKQWILGGYSSAFLGNWFSSGYLTDFDDASKYLSSTAFEVLDAMKATVPGVHHTLSFTMFLSAIAQREEGHCELVENLLELAVDECVRVYGKQKLGVMIKLIERAVDRVPL